MLRATQSARRMEEQFRHSYLSDEPTRNPAEEMTLSEIDNMLLEASDPNPRAPLAIHYQIDEMPKKSRINYKAPPSPKKRRQSFHQTAANINYEEMDETHLYDVMDQDSLQPLQIHMQFDEMPSGARVNYNHQRMKEEEEMVAIQAALEDENSIRYLLDDLDDALPPKGRSMVITPRPCPSDEEDFHVIEAKLAGEKFESLVTNMLAKSEERGLGLEAPIDVLDNEIEQQLDSGCDEVDVSSMTFATLMKMTAYGSKDAAQDFQGLKFFKNTLDMLLSPAILLPDMGGVI